MKVLKLAREVRASLDVIDHRMANPTADIVLDSHEGGLVSDESEYYVTNRRLKGYKNRLPKGTPVTIQSVQVFQNSDHEMWFKVTIRDYMNSPAGLVKPILPLMTYQYEYQELDSHPIWTTDIVFRAMMNYLMAK